MSTPLSRSSRTRWVPFGPDPHVTVGSRIRDSACQVGGYGPRVARVQRADHLISQGMGALLDRVNQFFARVQGTDRKSTRLNSSHQIISYAVFCLKKKNPIE